MGGGDTPILKSDWFFFFALDLFALPKNESLPSTGLAKPFFFSFSFFEVVLLYFFFSQYFLKVQFCDQNEPFFDNKIFIQMIHCSAIKKNKDESSI